MQNNKRRNKSGKLAQFNNQAIIKDAKQKKKKKINQGKRLPNIDVLAINSILFPKVTQEMPQMENLIRRKHNQVGQFKPAKNVKERKLS